MRHIRIVLRKRKRGGKRNAHADKIGVSVSSLFVILFAVHIFKYYRLRWLLVYETVGYVDGEAVTESTLR